MTSIFGIDLSNKKVVGQQPINASDSTTAAERIVGLDTVPVSKGGTGNTSLGHGGIFFGSGGEVMNTLLPGDVDGMYLAVSGNSGGNPTIGWFYPITGTRWSVGTYTVAGQSTEVIYPTDTDQRVAIGYNANINDYKLKVNGDAYINGPIYVETSSDHAIRIIRSGFTGISWYDTEANSRSNSNRAGYIQCDTSNKDMYINGERNTNISAGTGSIFMNDYVGFMSSTANYPIEVGNYANNYVGTCGFIRYIVSSGNWFVLPSSQTTRNVSIRTVGDVWVNSSGQSVIISSDRRIKTNIEDVPDNFALEQLRQIPTRQYEYIDKLSFGNQKQIGFIAQEVKEVMPNAVQSEGQDELIPDVFKIINCSWDGNRMSSTDLPAGVSGVEYKFTVSDTTDHEDEKEMALIGNEDDTFTFDKPYTTVFCYGSKVKDFHTIDYGKLHTLNFSATQQIDKIQQQHRVEIDALKAKVEQLEINIAAMINN